MAMNGLEMGWKWFETGLIHSGIADADSQC